MGEAKNRRNSDRFYGVSPKKGMGLVISSPTKVSGDEIKVQGQLDPQDLRFSLLFWDRFIWPENSFINVSGPESDFLIDAGLLRRPVYGVSGLAAQEIARIQHQAFLDVSHDEPGLWSLSVGQNSVQNLDDKFTENRGSSYSLYQAIPVPDKSIPLEDILIFKDKRRDELLALRIEIETFAKKIAKGGDEEESLLAAVSLIERASIDAIKVSREATFPIRLANLKTSFNIEWHKLIGAAMAGIAAQGIGMSALASFLTAAGVAVQTGSVTLKTSGDFGIKSNNLATHPYRYVASYHKDLFH